MPRRKRLPLRWSATAERNLESIHAYIAADSLLAADRFIARIRRAAERLGNLPYSGEVLQEDERGQVREIYVKSYRVVYLRSEDDLFVLSVVHGARN